MEERMFLVIVKGEINESEMSLKRAISEAIMKKKIKFTWEEKSSFDTERVGVMYCFKRCDVNQN